MFEFCGEYSETSKKRYIKILNDSLFYSVLIVCVVFGVIILSIAFTYNLWVLTVMFIPIVLSLIMVKAMPYIKRERQGLLMNFPEKVIITEENIIEVEWKHHHMEKSIDDVKKIVDFGESFLMKFYSLGGEVFCQKDLLVKGTMEEFESLFQGKIIKKYK